MQNINKEHKKLALWVGAGIIAGAIVTLSVQQLLVASNTQSKSRELQTNVANQASPAGESNTAASTSAADANAQAQVTQAAVQPADSGMQGPAFESPRPVSAALAILNGPPPPADTSGLIAPTGQHYGAVISSGYPAYTSGSRQVAQSAGTIIVQPQGFQETTQMIPPQSQMAQQTVGRNGLLENPPVDPASCKGLAYRSHYN